MFSTTLTRATHRASATPTAAALISSTSAVRSTQCLASRPSSQHARRQSSSKASCPPDSSNKSAAPAGKAAPAAAPSETQQSASSPIPQQRTSKRKGRLSRPMQTLMGASTATGERSSRARPRTIDQFAHLPAVPGWQLEEKELTMNALFALHRPLSLTPSIPPPTSPETFAALLSPSTSSAKDPWHDGNSAERRPEDVIYTLHTAIESLDAKQHGVSNASGWMSDEEEGLRWEILNESDDGQPKHLDSTSTTPVRAKTLEELVATFKPFRPPPPPQAFHEAPKDTRKRIAIASPTLATEKASSPKQESYETSIRVTVTTSSSGQKSYAATSSPIVRLPDLLSAASTSIAPPPSHQPIIRQPFAHRQRARMILYIDNMRRKLSERGMGERRAEKFVEMLLISVKRQRKLKMKKHKYKKLMKRTRNLRRRQDRT